MQCDRKSVSFLSLPPQLVTSSVPQYILACYYFPDKADCSALGFGSCFLPKPILDTFKAKQLSQNIFYEVFAKLKIGIGRKFQKLSFHKCVWGCIILFNTEGANLSLSLQHLLLLPTPLALFHSFPNVWLIICAWVEAACITTICYLRIEMNVLALLFLFRS